MMRHVKMKHEVSQIDFSKSSALNQSITSVFELRFLIIYESPSLVARSS